jgi:hypothetical protein
MDIVRRAAIVGIKLIVAIGLLHSFILPSWATADITITGTSDEARVEVRNIALERVLSDLRERFDLAYVSSVSLDNKIIEGTYAGPLTHILPRLLKGYDYAMRIQDRRIFLVLTNQEKSGVDVKSASSADSAALQPSRAFQTASVPGTIVSKKDSTWRSVKAIPTTPTAALGKPTHQVVANFMGMQLRPFVNPAASLIAPVSLAQNVDSETPRQVIVQTTQQRANVTLQALAVSLAGLPK